MHPEKQSGCTHQNERFDRRCVGTRWRDANGDRELPYRTHAVVHSVHRYRLRVCWFDAHAPERSCKAVRVLRRGHKTLSGRFWASWPFPRNRQKELLCSLGCLYQRRTRTVAYCEDSDRTTARPWSPAEARKLAPKCNSISRTELHLRMLRLSLIT